MAADRWWKRPAARGILGAVGFVALLFLVAFLTLTIFQQRQGDTVLAGVHVDGRSVGGASADELSRVVDEAGEQRLQQPVQVIAGEEELRTSREEIGAGVEARTTVDRAWERGRRGLWRSLWDHLQARRGRTVDIPVELTLERSALEAWARDAAAELSLEPRDATIAFVTVDGDPPRVDLEVTEPEVGQEVAATDLADELDDALAVPGEVAVEVAAEPRDPTITAADLDAVRVDAARAVSAPVRLVNPADADDLELQPDGLASLIDIDADPSAAEGERLRLNATEERLLELLGDVERFAADPVDAEFSVSGDAVEIVGGTPGFTLDPAATAAHVLEVAVQEEGGPGDPRQSELPGETVEPDVTREELEELGIEEEVASFTTDLVPGEPRNTNIQLGADLLHGAVIEPGQTFSLNDRLGPRTSERGFVENGYIDEDGELTEVVGGGSSQLGTTFFNAAWFAGIEILEFQPHSLYFDRYPMGREATLSYGTIDVVVENDSPYGILVATEHSDSSVTVRFFSSPWAEVETWTGEPFDRVPGAVRDGFAVEFGRTITYPDGSTRSEDHIHRYDPED